MKIGCTRTYTLITNHIPSSSIADIAPESARGAILDVIKLAGIDIAMSPDPAWDCTIENPALVLPTLST